MHQVFMEKYLNGSVYPAGINAIARGLLPGADLFRVVGRNDNIAVGGFAGWLESLTPPS